jgi:hypothetical protein
MANAGTGLRRRSFLLVLGVFVALCGSIRPGLAESSDLPANVALIIIPREALFFSAISGVWTSVRLDAGERIIQSGSDGNVAAVATSQRILGFSADLNQLQEVRLPEDERVDAFKVEGNVASILTRRRAFGFSAATGRWTEVERFLPAR